MCVSAARRVERLEEKGRAAIVAVDGVDRRVALDLLVVEGTAVAPGDWLLVHAGAAISRLTPEMAADLLETGHEVKG